MKPWKVWTLSGVVVAVGTVGALTAALWRNVSSEWVVEQNAAQYALDHSPIDQIKAHSIFTASQAQEVFFGTDVFKRPWYAFVYGSPFIVQSVPVTGIMPETEVVTKARSQNIQPISVSIGYLNAEAQQACHTSSTVVWEVYGKLTSGKTVYLYLDAYTGARAFYVML